MNSDEKPDSRSSREILKTKKRWPRKMTLWTLFVVLIAIAVRFGADFVNFRFGIPTDIINVSMIALMLLTWCLWIGWALIWGGRSFLARFGVATLILGGGLAVPLLLEFQHTGDMKIVSVKPRFLVKKLLDSPDPKFEKITEFGSNELTDFTGFLGSKRNGIVTGASIDPNWDSHPPKLLWKVDVGEGWSGISAVGGYAFTMEQRDEECTSCYEIATGKMVWQFRNPQRHDDQFNMGYAGPRSTPTINENRVYSQGATGTLICLDAASGEKIWSNEVEQLVKAESITKNALLTGKYRQETRLSWGRAISPLIVGNLVITGGGGPDENDTVTLVAFDKLNGDIVWKGGKEMIAYGSPSLATVGGQPQIMIAAERNAIGVSVADGRLLWKHPWPGNSTGDANTSQVTAVSDNRFLLTKGYGAGGKLVELSPADEGFAVKEIWANKRVLRTKMTNPVVYNGSAYAISDGFIECVDLASGELKWKERARAGNGQLLLVGDKLMVHSEDGRLMLIEAVDTGFTKLGEIKTISGICWNYFCVTGRYVIVRSNKEMACFELSSLSTDQAH